MTLEFYASPASTAPASIQGQTYIGAANVTTDANGNATFTATLSATVPPARSSRRRCLERSRPTSNFSNAVTVVVTSSATFLATDTTTQGTWRNAYGADGYDIAADTSATNPKLPSYATLGITGASTYTWADEHHRRPRPAERRQHRPHRRRPGTPRTSMSFNLNLTDGKSHEVSLYAVDYDNQSRSEQVQVIDAATGKVLTRETIGSFQSGEYLSWNLSGNVVIKVTNLNPSANAVDQRDLLRRQAAPPRPPPSWARTRRPRVAGAGSTAPTATTSPPTPAPPTPSSPPTPPWASPAPRPTSGPRAPPTPAPCRTRPTPAASPRPGTPAPR